MNIDDMAFPETKKWMDQNNLLPSTWGLNAIEQNRICGLKFSIAIFSQPACCTPTMRGTSQLMDVVHFSGEYLITGKLSREEMIACILHEIGHVVNDPYRHTQTHGDGYWLDSVLSEREACADDYVRHCQYGAHLGSALAKLEIISGIGFKSSITGARIKRVNENVRLRLYFI